MKNLEGKLLALRVIEPWAVEIMRQLYHSTKPWLEVSEPLPSRTIEEQQAWWNDMPHPKIAHLYTPVEEPWNFVAFSIVQRKGNFNTPIFGIHPAYHRRGYGEVILHHYLEVADGPLAGSDKLTNGAIIKLNDRNGWKVIDVDDKGVRKLFHPGVHDDRQQEIYDEICRYHGYHTGDNYQ